MSTWIFKIDYQLGAGWVDISSFLKVDPKGFLIPVTRNRSLHNGQKCTSNTAQVTITRNTSLMQSLFAAAKPIKAWIQKDGSDYFTGFIRPTFQGSVGPIRANEVKIELVDKWYFLQYAKTSAAVGWFGYAVSSPLAKTTSILHQLFYAAGFIDAELNFPAIATILPAFTMAMDDSYKTVIEDILFEYGYVASIDASGIVQLVALSPSSVTPAATLATGSNIVGDYEPSRSECAYEGVDVNFYEALTLAGATVFEDNTGGTGALPMNVALAPGAYYPPNASASIIGTLQYAIQNNKILGVSNFLALGLLASPNGNLTTQVWTPGPLTAQIRLLATGGVTITQLRVIGDAIVQGDLHTMHHDFNAGSSRIEKIDSKYIFDSTTADTLSQSRNNWNQLSQIKYKMRTSRLATNPGEYLTLSETLLGISQTVRVVSVQDGASPEFVNIECEAFSALTLVSPVQSRYMQITASPPPAPGAMVNPVFDSGPKVWQQSTAPTIGARPNAVNGDIWVKPDGTAYSCTAGSWSFKNFMSQLSPTIGLNLNAAGIGYYDGVRWISQMAPDGKFYFSGASGSLIWDGLALGVGSGGYNSGTQKIYMDALGKLSLGTALTFDGAGNLAMTGSITAASGAIGGFTIGVSTISATNLALTSGAANVANITVGTSYFMAGLGSPAAYTDTAIWAGATFANRGIAPFRVRADGILVATSAIITGAITATSGSFTGTLTSTSGTIGGWSLGATALVAGTGANSVGIDSGGTNPAFYAGSATPASAPFRVMPSGAVYTGNLTATGGVIGGITLSSTSMSANYASGSTGFIIDNTGFAEFNNINVRGNVNSTSGSIGGWLLTTTTLDSAASGNARISLDKGNMRVAILNNLNATKVAMGYLGGLAKNDGSGNWTTSDYGFWADAGDSVRVDGKLDMLKGDLVNHNGAVKILNSSGCEILRMGDNAGNSGHHWFSALGVLEDSLYSDGAGLVLKSASTTGYSYLKFLNAGTGNAYVGLASSINDHMYLINQTANSLYLGTNGAVSLTIDPSGNVGIGMTPTSKLDVQGVISYGALARGSLSYGSNVITLESQTSNTSIALLPSGTGNVGIGTTIPSQKLEVSGGAIIASGFANRAAGTGKALEIGMDGTQGILQAFDRTAVADIPLNFEASKYIFNTGSIGIGISNPGAKLDISANNAIAARGVATTGYVVYQLYNSGTDFQMGISTSGGIYWGDGAYSGGYYATIGTNTGTAPLIFATNNAKRMIIDSAGKVGIGIISPSQALDVSGNIQASGYFMGPGTGLTGTAASLTAGTANAVSFNSGLTTMSSPTFSGLTLTTLNGYTPVQSNNVNSYVLAASGTAASLTAGYATNALYLNYASLSTNANYYLAFTDTTGYRATYVNSNLLFNPNGNGILSLSGDMIVGGSLKVSGLGARTYSSGTYTTIGTYVISNVGSYYIEILNSTGNSSLDIRDSGGTWRTIIDAIAVASGLFLISDGTNWRINHGSGTTSWQLVQVF